jgi:molecular chaperone DnaK
LNLHDSETEKLMMICVEFFGIFSDSGELARSFSMRRLDNTSVTLFERGSKIPAYTNQTVSTTDDGQHAIEIRVFWNADDLGDNLYAKYLIHGIAPAPKGVAKAEISFEALIDGSLKVTARDERTKMNLRVTPK